jgi:hypothetical protein
LVKLNEGLLANGSELEVEIRGCSIAAVEKIVTFTKKAIDDEGLNFPFVNSALVAII